MASTSLNALSNLIMVVLGIHTTTKRHQETAVLTYGSDLPKILSPVYCFS